MKSLLTLTLLIASTLTPNLINKSTNLINKASQQTINYGDLSNEEIINYYSSISVGDKGEDLLNKLQTVLKTNQQKVVYASGNNSSKNWDGYFLYERNFDLSPLEDSELGGNYKRSGVWLNIMYEETPIYFTTGINQKGEIKYYDENNKIVSKNSTSNNVVNREHVWPKSFGFNGANDLYKDLTAGCDAINLHAAEANGNQSGHSNFPYGDVLNKETSEKTYSTLTGNLVGYTGLNASGNKVFEPLNSWKGDIARSIFYMAARYHTYEHLGGVDETPSLALGNNIDAIKTTEPSQTKNNPAIYGQLDDLLKWNELDPVSEFEIHRNNLIYNNVQYNRNPFIDFPSWANACFTPESSSGVNFDNISSFPQDNHQYVLKINPSPDFKRKYYNFEKFNPENLKLDFTVDGIYTPIDKYEIYMGNQIMTSDYTFVGVGTYELKAVVYYGNTKITSINSVSIKLELSIPQVVIVSIIGLILLSLIIWFLVWASKRKNRKKIKSFENKVTKASKEINKAKNKTKKKKKNSKKNAS